MSDVFGLCMVKNEEDIFERTLNHFVDQKLDHIVILNNLSTDKTEEIIFRVALENPGKISMINDSEFGYNQVEKMNNAIKTWLVPMSDDFWIVPFDADELWWGLEFNLHDQIHETDADVLYFRVHTMRPNGKMDEAAERFPVVAYKYNEFSWLLDGNHEVSHNTQKSRQHGGFVQHYQYRSLEQFKRKVREGRKAIEASSSYQTGFGEHWMKYGSMSDETLEIIWNQFSSGEIII